MSRQLSMIPIAPRGVRAAEAPVVVKWVGSKGWLAGYLAHRLLPRLLAGALYVEPFAGSLAMFIELRLLGWRGPAVLSDLNPHLIGLYKTLRAGLAEKVWAALVLLNTARGEELWPSMKSKEHFLEVRRQFNRGELSGLDASEVDAIRCAQVLYLNHFGFNGLWRVNKKGQINTPFGGERRECLLTLSRLVQFGELLQNTVLLCLPYQQVLWGKLESLQGAVVYADPPYDCEFTSYCAAPWLAADHARLASDLGDACEDGAAVVVSNSDTPLIRRIYEGWALEEIPIRYQVGGSSTETKELLFSRGVL